MAVAMLDRPPLVTDTDVASGFVVRPEVRRRVTTSYRHALDGGAAPHVAFVEALEDFLERNPGVPEDAATETVLSICADLTE